MNVVIRITGYDRQLRVISLIKLIREATGDGLAVTKGRVDHLLETGEAFEIVLPNNGDATAFASKATGLGEVVASGIMRAELLSTAYSRARLSKD